MKYTFTYRTPDNVIHHDVIAASSHEEVYRKLRPRGIKPYNVVLAPGLLNTLCRPGKRGWSIIVLGALLLALVMAWVGADRRAARLERESRGTRREASGLPPVPRQQIAALPADWRAQLARYLPSPTDVYFALYAQPGLPPASDSDVMALSFGNDLNAPLAAAPADPAWVATLKRIVAGMKADARSLRSAGKSDAEISLWLTERQRMEADYRRQLVQRVKRGAMTRDEADRLLRAMGLAELE